jgi:acetyl-CoA acetyltransferase
MTTLIYALKNRNKRCGLQPMCEGGGVASVTIVGAPLKNGETPSAAYDL